MKTYFVDTETCGLHGVPVLLQYAIDDGPVHLVHIWGTPLNDLISLIEDMVTNRVVAHNLRFDWFHISKLYNMLRWLKTAKFESIDVGTLKLSNIDIDIVVEAEWESQFGPCLKPHAAIDTLLLASKCEDQSFLMAAKAIYVRRVPFGLADSVCNELNLHTDLPWILFAGKKKAGWEVVANTDRRTGEPDPMWRDIKISFAPSKSLKDLAVYLCNHDLQARFADIAPETHPAEEGFAPFARLLSNEERGWLYNGLSTWPALIQEHIKHWLRADALQYAEDDITMLRKLYCHFGSLEDDRDSILACQVASVRLRGFAIDVEATYQRLRETNEILGTAQLNVNSPKQVAAYVAEALDSMEQLILSEGCNQKIIDSIKKEFTLDEPEECYCSGGKIIRGGEEVESICPRCAGAGTVGPTGSCPACNGSGVVADTDKKCPECDGTGLSSDRKMPVVRRVEHIELIRKHTKRKELYHKLLLAKRAYPDFNVIGAKSGRMSGASGLNFQGIDHSQEVRALFTLADQGQILSAGDYSSQELAIAATTMNDDDLMQDMKSGKSLHGLFAAECYKTTYEDIIEHKEDDDRYAKAKAGIYAILYGGTVETVAKNMVIDLEIVKAAYDRLCTKYPQMGLTRKAITERFSSMKQDADRKITYEEPPAKYIESIFGFRRYFHTEYALQKMILNVIKNMPLTWQNIDLVVERTKGKFQTVSGAVSSALYGAAFSIQNKIIRASNNHLIQSTGRELTIGMQAEVWKLQPCGIHPFSLAIMSIHDELAVVSPPEMVDKIRDTIERKVMEQCQKVPLTRIDWYTGNKSWAEKSSGEQKKTLGWGG